MVFLVRADAVDDEGGASVEALLLVCDGDIEAVAIFTTDKKAHDYLKACPDIEGQFRVLGILDLDRLEGVLWSLSANDFKFIAVDPSPDVFTPLPVSEALRQLQARKT